MGNEEVIEYLGEQTLKTPGDILLNLDCCSITSKKPKDHNSLSGSDANAQDDGVVKDNSIKFNKLLKDEKGRLVSTKKQQIQKKCTSNDSSLPNNITLEDSIINNDVKIQKSSPKANLTVKRGNLQTGANIKIPIQIHHRPQQQSPRKSQLAEPAILAKEVLHSIRNEAFSTSDKINNKTEFGHETTVSEIIQNSKMGNPALQIETSIPTSQSSQSEQIEPDTSNKPRIITAQGTSLTNTPLSSNQSNILLTEFAEKLKTNVVFENVASPASVVKASKKDPKSEGVIEKENLPEQAKDKQYSKSVNIQKSDKPTQQDSETEPDLSEDDKHSPIEKNNTSTAQLDRTVVRNSTEVKPLPTTSPARTASMTELPVDQVKLVNSVKLTLASGRSELTIQLKPEMLGHALITLRQVENGLEMEFQVESIHAKHLIEAEAPQIKEALAALGIQTSNIDVRTTDSNPERFTIADNGSNGQRKQEQHNREDARMEQQRDNMMQFRNLGYNTFEIAA